MDVANQLKKLDTSIKLSIVNPNSERGSVFGKGIADLCLGVRNFGSLNAAAKNLRMAYSKAWRIIKDTESTLGVQLLNRDGAHGSQLTEAGNMLLDTYLSVNNKLKKEASKLYQKAL